MSRRLLGGRVGLAATLLLLVPLLMLLSLRVGSAGLSDLPTLLRGVLGALGLGDGGLDASQQAIVELRLWRVLTTAGVGAALGLSGALVQGLFRNGLAAPSILGITGGASLGATLAILLLSGYGGALVAVQDAGVLTLLVPLFGFVGALVTVLVVLLLASPGGRISVPSLLLTGIAVNTCVAGLLSLLSSLVLEDWEVSRAVLAWTFGTLDDRAPAHAGTVWLCLAVAASVVPFVAWELDLLQGGEDDARSLGVSTARVRALVVGAAALSAASAVAVAGQIAFVGLVVPHIVRQFAGRAHAAVLPISLLAGADFLLGVDLLNRWLLGAAHLPPGVVMSLVGGPFFLVLLALNRREVETW
ncbi:MAG: iron ABC transporter permease [Planctomycetes bacterium]|nr:iron ABC transporter permease [Planctomycetota bacterium]